MVASSNIISSSRMFIAAALMACAAGSASASMVQVSNPFLTVNASSSLGSASFSVPFPDPNIIFIDDPDFTGWGWEQSSIGGPLDIMDGSTRIATIIDLATSVWRFIDIDGTTEYRVNLQFNLVAANAATQFEILSPALFFDPISNQLGFASAGLTTTDQDFNGVALSGDHSNNAAFRAFYNANTDFALLRTNDLVAGPGGTVSDPPNGTQEVFAGFAAGPISSMQSSFKFTLSGNDSVGGTSTFVFVPSPGAIALMVFGGVTLIRRRRDR